MCKLCEAGLYRSVGPGRPRGPGQAREDSIPVDLFRDRALELVESGQTSWNVIAKRMGWTRTMNRKDRPNPSREGDVARLKRTLGLLQHTVTRRHGSSVYRYHYTQRNVMPETAARLATALEMDPVDAGI